MTADVMQFADVVEGRPYKAFSEGELGFLPLSRGLWAVVDVEDFERCAAFKWSATSARARGHSAYAVRTDGNSRIGQRGVKLHRFVVGAVSGELVDHRNGDGLDNRRANLRKCTAAENNCNRVRARGASKFHGVIWDQSRRQWQARVSFKGRTFNGGRFSDEIAAARARDALAKDLQGPFARLNFPLNNGDCQ